MTHCHNANHMLPHENCRNIHLRACHNNAQHLRLCHRSTKGEAPLHSVIQFFLLLAYNSLLAFLLQFQPTCALHPLRSLPPGPGFWGPSWPCTSLIVCLPLAPLSLPVSPDCVLLSSSSPSCATPTYTPHCPTAFHCALSVFALSIFSIPLSLPSPFFFSILWLRNCAKGQSKAAKEAHSQDATNEGPITVWSPLRAPLLAVTPWMPLETMHTTRRRRPLFRKCREAEVDPVNPPFRTRSTPCPIKLSLF